ncbi:MULTISPECIES: RHS repeat domain-containing protein [unclassified Heyndrickxia]|uniref:RHS repeat domain-containing protein n=1 Tax=unclassified Heyndrickxia TaxID=2837518 RepID=UPI0030F731C7
MKKNGTAFTYDKDGNLTQDENDKYTYNALGQMTKVTTLSGTTVAEYTYDENGLRTKKTVGTKTNEYYYDQDNNLSMEVVKNNGTITQYKYYKWDSDGTTPLGMIIRQQDSTGQWANKAYFFWTNHRGDVISIVDQSGNEVGSYTYDAYGNVLTETGEIAKYNPIRYAGYYYDAETKDYYLKARYYNPANGTFLAMDPQPGQDSDPVSQNGYTYAKNNPVMLTDPNGDVSRKHLIYAIKYAIKYWLASYIGWDNASWVMGSVWASVGAGSVAYKIERARTFREALLKLSRRAERKAILKVARRAGMRAALRVGIKAILPFSVVEDGYVLTQITKVQNCTR